MAPRFTLAEVYTDLACKGGTALCAIPDLLTLERSRFLPTTGDNELAGTLPRKSRAWLHLRERRVVRLTFKDQVTGTVSFEEWRITELTEEAGKDGGLRSGFTALWPEVDLATCGEMEKVEADGTIVDTFEPGPQTPAQYVALILARMADLGVTHFAAGTIDATAPVDLVFSKMTPMAALLYLAESISGTTGRRCEFQVRRNGTTNYLIDLVTQIGASAPRRYLQVGKNLQGLRRSRSAVDLCTAVRPSGAEVDGVAASLSEALWKVSSTPSGTTARLVDPVGGDGPILENDQLGGATGLGIPNKYVRKWPAGPWIEVTDSAFANQEITTGSAHSFAPNDLVQFAADSNGKALTTLESPSAIALYGRVVKPLDRGDIPGHINLLANPAQRDYAAAANGPPDTWSIIPGCGLAAANVDRESAPNRTRTGQYSAKVTTTGDGQGIETAYGTVTPTDKRPNFSGFVGFWNDTDGARVRTEVVAGIAPISISSMSRAGNSLGGGKVTVTVHCIAAHNVALGDLVEILGVTGASTADGYNGVQKVSRVLDSDSYEFQLNADPGNISLSSATMRRVWLYTAAGSPNSKRWSDLGWQNADFKARNATVTKNRCMQDGSTGLTMYVDRAQTTQGAGEGQLAFIEGSGGTRIWQAGNRYLGEKNTPEVRYDVEALDLGRLDPRTWKYDDFELGGAIDVNDQRWGVAVSTRVLGFTQLLRGSGGEDALIQLTLSSRPGDFTDETVRPRRPGRLPIGDPGLRRRIYTVRYQAARFKQKSGTDAANIVWNLFGGADTGIFPINGATIEADASISDELRARGGRIVGFRCEMFSTGAGVGTLTLYRDSTVLSVLDIDGEMADNLLSQRIGAEAYRVDLVLEQISSTIFTYLTWFEIDIELDDEIQGS